MVARVFAQHQVCFWVVAVRDRAHVKQVAADAAGGLISQAALPLSPAALQSAAFSCSPGMELSLAAKGIARLVAEGRLALREWSFRGLLCRDVARVQLPEGVGSAG